MANQNTYILSLDNDPVPDINSELLGLSKNLKEVNSDFTILIKDINTSILPLFNSINNLFAEVKKVTGNSNFAFQTIQNTASNPAGSQLANSPGFSDYYNEFHSLVHMGSDFTSGVNNLYQLRKLSQGDMTLGEATTAGKFLSTGDEAFSAVDDLPGFIGEKAAAYLLGDLVAPEIVGLIQLFVGLGSLAGEAISSISSSNDQSGGSTEQGVNKDLFKQVQAQARNTHFTPQQEMNLGADYDPSAYIDYFKQYADYQKFAKYYDDLLKSLENKYMLDPSHNKLPKAEEGLHKFMDLSENDYVQANPLFGVDQKIFGKNMGIDNTPPAATNKATTNPSGGIPVSQNITINNRYQNLIGQFTINSSNLQMDLAEVKMLVAEAIMQAASDVHVKGL